MEDNNSVHLWSRIDRKYCLVPTKFSFTYTYLSVTYKAYFTGNEALCDVSFKGMIILVYINGWSRTYCAKWILRWRFHAENDSKVSCSHKETDKCFPCSLKRLPFAKRIECILGKTQSNGKRFQKRSVFKLFFSLERKAAVFKYIRNEGRFRRVSNLLDNDWPLSAETVG